MNDEHKSLRYQIHYLTDKDKDRRPVVIDSHDGSIILDDASLQACAMRADRLNRLYLEELNESTAN